MFAAALTVASTVASAAEMKFDIPFAFQAGGKLMGPGKYTVRGSGSESNFLIQNAQSSEGLYVLVGASQAAGRRNGPSKPAGCCSLNAPTAGTSLAGRIQNSTMNIRLTRSLGRGRKRDSRRDWRQFARLWRSRRSGICRLEHEDRPRKTMACPTRAAEAKADSRRERDGKPCIRGMRITSMTSLAGYRTG